MFLEYLFTYLTFFVIALYVTNNICSLVINHGDKTVSKLYPKESIYQYKGSYLKELLNQG